MHRRGAERVEERKQRLAIAEAIARGPTPTALNAVIDTGLFEKAVMTSTGPIIEDP
jgi:hypothetical protein